MNLSVYDGARWVSITPHAFSHAIGGKDELIPEAIGAASTLFVEDAIAAHLDETDPHPQYLTQSEGDTLYAGASAISTHVAAGDPHPQYLTQGEGDTLYAGASAISTHVAASDPHPQYLTQGEGDTLYAGASAISTHVAASDPHPQYLTQGEGDTLYAPNNAIASHLAASNPHLITPTLIGAAPTSHTHTGAQITGNISGNASNITGIAAIANGGTGASTAPAALTNLGAAAASHTHAASAINSGTLAIGNGGTGASTAPQALVNLGAAAASHTHNFNIVKYAVTSGTRITSSIDFNVSNNIGYKIIALFSHNGRISGATGYACAREFIAAFSATIGLQIYDLYNLTSSTGGSITISLNTNTMVATVTKVAGTEGTNFDGIFSVFVTV